MRGGKSGRAHPARRTVPRRFNTHRLRDVPLPNAAFATVAAGLRHLVAIKTAPLGGGGTDNYIPKWAGTSDLEDSAIYQTDAGNIGIGTTTLQTVFQVGAGMTTFSTFLAPTKQVCPGQTGYGTQGIGFNLFRRDDGTWETPEKSGGAALFGHFYGLSIACVNSAPPTVPTTFTDAQIAESVAMTILADGRVGLGRWPSATLDVGGNVRIREMRSTTSGVLMSVDGNGELLRISSSRRYKTNVRDLQEDAEKVLDLRPVRFQVRRTSA
ncbi:MAG: hypothetical protein A2Y77_05660 [Planctomycetes bacterium RBG_13_62_9]|nr:MAG: hypothetical protein A2Y77_05660 [Planctomycetes bacterium RBG_13_62_9]